MCFFFVFHLPGQGSNVRIESGDVSTYAFEEYIVAYGPLLKGKKPGAASSSSTLSGWLVEISASGSVREERRGEGRWRGEVRTECERGEVM